jgi:hypothetical protein
VRVTHGFGDSGDVVVEVLVDTGVKVDERLGRYGSILCACEIGKCKASRIGKLLMSIDGAKAVESGNVLGVLFFNMMTG